MLFPHEGSQSHSGKSHAEEGAERTELSFTLSTLPQAAPEPASRQGGLVDSC